MRLRLTLFSIVTLLLLPGVYFAWPVMFEQYLHYAKKPEPDYFLGQPARASRYDDERPIPTALSHARRHGFSASAIERGAVTVAAAVPPDATVTRVDPMTLSPIRTSPEYAEVDLRIHEIVRAWLPKSDAPYYFEISLAQDGYAVVRVRKEGFDAEFRVDLSLHQ